MKAFDKWAKKNFCTEDDCWNDWDDGYHAGIKAGWRAALKWVLTMSPIGCECGATFANQGQSMDGFSMLAHFRDMDQKIRKEIEETEE